MVRGEDCLIGVIGPEDTAALIEEVADQIGIKSLLLVARYRLASETPELVRAVNAVCSVILFSGRLPFSIAIAAGYDAENFDYIPHEGADLFRALAIVALSQQHQGHVPRLSFDSMTEEDVREAYKELGLKRDFHVIPLEIAGESAESNIDRIIKTHRWLLEEQKIEICTTCISSVFDALLESTLPVFRISHSRISVRQALLRVQLRHELNQAEATQVAICVLAPRPDFKAKQNYAAKKIYDAAKLLADSAGARILKSDSNEALLLTTRGAIDRLLKIFSSSTSRMSDSEFILGIGIGRNTDQAEIFARQAHQRASASPNQYFQIEHTTFVVEAADLNEAREIRQFDIERARRSQVSPIVIRRLGTVFQELDPNGFTAAEFAKIYNVQSRSARRLITFLKDRGFVEECGFDVRKSAGRPQHIYRIFLNQLLFPAS
jgi:hypothetical protein